MTSSLIIKYKKRQYNLKIFLNLAQSHFNNQMHPKPNALYWNTLKCLSLTVFSNLLILFIRSEINQQLSFSPKPNPFRKNTDDYGGQREDLPTGKMSRLEAKLNLVL